MAENIALMEKPDSSSEKVDTLPRMREMLYTTSTAISAPKS